MAKPPYPPSYYAATANPAPDHPVLTESLSCDVCVVGGGYTGLSTALDLAERGFNVALLEARRIGWGASGRNGGHVAWGYAAEMEAIERAVGLEDAKRLWALSLEAVDIVRERVQRHRIACDLKLNGYFVAALKARQMRALEARARRLAERYGYGNGRLVGRDEAGTIVRSPRYVGGYFHGDAGHLHPLNYCLGLADAAQRAGARLFEGSPVTALAPGAKIRIATPEGRIEARYAVLCANAYLGSLAPEIRSKIMPAATFMTATEPLGEARARALIPDDIAVSDCNFVLDYYRLSADHRLLFGGGISYSTLAPVDLKAAMRRAMLKVFPQLSDVRMAFGWDGLVGITVERTPHFGRLGGNVYFAQGFSGHGIALTGLAGRLIAEALAGEAGRFELLARLPHRSFPGGPGLRTPLLALAMLYYRLRDLL